MARIFTQLRPIISAAAFAGCFVGLVADEVTEMVEIVVFVTLPGVSERFRRFPVSFASERLVVGPAIPTTVPALDSQP